MLHGQPYGVYLPGDNYVEEIEEDVEDYRKLLTGGSGAGAGAGAGSRALPSAGVLRGGQTQEPAK
jgi:hypothetical protein